MTENNNILYFVVTCLIILLIGFGLMFSYDDNAKEAGVFIALISGLCIIIIIIYKGLDLLFSEEDLVVESNTNIPEPIEDTCVDDSSLSSSYSIIDDTSYAV